MADAHNIAAELSRIAREIEHRPIEEIGPACAEYAERYRETLSPATIRNRIAYLRAAVRYSWKRYGMGSLEWIGRIQTPQVSNERHVYLKLPQQRALLGAIPREDSRAVFTLAFYIGGRWRKAVLARTQADIERKGKRAWLVIGITKNGERRMKPVHPDAQWALEHIPFTRHWREYYRDFETARASLGLQHVTAHDARHTLASLILSSGGSLPDVQGALDQKSAQSAKRYAHLYPERLEKVLLGVGKLRQAKRKVPRGAKKKAA